MAAKYHAGVAGLQVSLMEVERDIDGGVSEPGRSTATRGHQQFNQASDRSINSLSGKSLVGHHYLGYARVVGRQSGAKEGLWQLQETVDRGTAAHAPATGNVNTRNSGHSGAHIPDGSTDASWIHVHDPHPSKQDVGSEVRRPRDAQDEAGLWGRYRDDPLHLRHPGS